MKRLHVTELGLLAALLIGPGSVYADPAELFGDLPSDGFSLDALLYDASRSRQVLVDAKLLGRLATERGGELDLNFFADTVLRAQIEHAVVRNSRSFTLLGRCAGDPMSSVVLTVHGNASVGTIRPSSGPVYVLDCWPEGRQVVSALPLGTHSWCDVTAFSRSSGLPTFAFPPREPQRSDTSLSVIDVLVLYTPAAADSAGGTDGVLALVHRAADEMNFALHRSKTPAQIRLVDIMGIDYIENPSSPFDDLMCVAFSPSWCNGDLADGNSIVLRNAAGADLVSLVMHGGITSQATGLISLNPDESELSAFSVIQRIDLLRDVFAHELGHNLGCGHDRDSTGHSQLFDYSCGVSFRSYEGRKRTIMAYGGTSLLTYSNPDLYWGNYSLGVPIDQPNSAHNSLTISETAAFVAAYRAAIVSPCLGDLNGDSCVDQHDLGVLLTTYELSPQDPMFNANADIDHDSDVDSADLAILLDRYGTLCDQ